MRVGSGNGERETISECQAPSFLIWKRNSSRLASRIQVAESMVTPLRLSAALKSAFYDPK